MWLKFETISVFFSVLKGPDIWSFSWRRKLPSVNNERRPPFDTMNLVALV
jgi:hypothetical protein